MWKDRTIKCTDTFELRDVDPEYARKLLNSSPGNRSDKSAHQLRMASTMDKFGWFIGESMILIDESGLRNGHNRLMAVILSGCVVTMLFRIRKKGSFSPEEMRAIDTGMPRNMEDAAAFDDGMQICSRRNKAAMMMMLGQGNSFTKQSNEIIYQLELYYRDSIEFIEDIFGPYVKRNITVGPVMGVFMAAYYAYPNDRHKIQQIGRFLIDPFSDEFSGKTFNGMKTIGKLRDELTERSSVEKGDDRRTTYRKVEFALDKALNGIDVDKIEATSVSLFPVDIPESIGVVKPSGNNKLLSYLPFAVQKLRDQEIIPVKTLADKLLEAGYPSKTKNPSAEVGRLISKPLRDGGVLVFSNGKLLPVIDSEDQKRLRKVKFIAERE